MVPRARIYMPHSSAVVDVTRCTLQALVILCQLRAVAFTTGGYLHLVLLRSHCCCCELRAAGRAYWYLLLVQKAKRDQPTYLL